jgi:hypothetical protein
VSSVPSSPEFLLERLQFCAELASVPLSRLDKPLQPRCRTLVALFVQLFAVLVEIAEPSP